MITDHRPVPLFHRGSEESDYCDFILPSGPRAGDACDASPDYEVRWLPVRELDGDTLPVSGVCTAHVSAIDRSLVARMTTHPHVIDAHRRDA